MVDRIFLLTGEQEIPVLSRVLQNQNVSIAVQGVSNSDDLSYAASARSSGRIRLIAFSTNVLVKKEILDICDAGALNFHPGPPAVPGVHTAAFALYENLKTFGITAHHMSVKPDDGTIITVERFQIEPTITRDALEIETYTALARLFMAMSPDLSNMDYVFLPDPQERWAGQLRTFALYDQLRQIRNDLDPGEIARRRRAFAGDVLEDDDAPERRAKESGQNHD